MVPLMAAREKQFHTQCQEEVYRQVKTYLDELVDEHFDDASHCDFYLKYGSTVLEISIHPWEEDDAVIEVLAFCVKGCQPTLELLQELLELNTEIILGVKRVQAEAWDMGHAAAKGYDLSYELDRKEWEEEFALVRTTNPYREA